MGNDLTRRENEVMDCVASGMTNEVIGTVLGISQYTVKNHMARIFQKLNVFNRIQAVNSVRQLKETQG